MNLANLTVTSAEDIILKPRTAARTIGISGGAGDLQITDAMIAMMNPGDTLVIGDSAAGTGAVDVSAWDISGETFNVGVYGGTVDFTGAFTYNGANDLTFHSRTGNLAWDQAITKSAGGDSFLTMKAAGTITMTQNFAPAAGAVDVTLWSDGDNNGVGGITLTNVAITSGGGDVILGGGTDPATDEAVGTTNYGVELNNGDISSGAGHIGIRGRGEAAGTDNYGIYVHNGSALQTTAGNITFTGTGGAGTDDNNGIYLLDGGTTISTVDGDMTLDGTGGGDGTGIDNRGIYIFNATLSSTGMGGSAGTINLDGTGGSGTQSDVGVRLENFATIVTADGNIDIEGVGNGVDAFGQFGVGIDVIMASTISSTANGDIILTGSSLSDGILAMGIRVSGTSVIAGVDGDITLDGTASAAGGLWSMGVEFNNADVDTSGNGNIIITGVADGSGDDSYGVEYKTSRSPRRMATLPLTGPVCPPA